MRPLILVIKVNIFLMGVLGFSGQTLAQNYDGITVESSGTNGNSFYYGEPFNVYFKVKNTDNSINYVFKPEEYVNLKFSLKEVNSNSNVPNLEALVMNDLILNKRDRMKTKKPSKSEYYSPMEEGYKAIMLLEYFGSDKLSQKKLRHSSLVYALKAIPPGEYELTIEYRLYPSDKVIKATHRFKILKIETKEQQAFQRYVSATEYACSSHFYGDRNYSASHPDSYDNFIKDFPKSIYATHAFMNMMTQSYYYAQGGPSLNERVAKFKEYLNYYPELVKNTKKMDYISYLPKMITLIPGKDLKKELDSFLLKIKDDNPEISDKLIRTAMFRHNITGLTNYAREVKR